MGSRTEWEESGKMAAQHGGEAAAKNQGALALRSESPQAQTKRRARWHDRANLSRATGRRPRATNSTGRHAVGWKAAGCKARKHSAQESAREDGKAESLSKGMAVEAGWYTRKGRGQPKEMHKTSALQRRPRTTEAR